MTMKKILIVAVNYNTYSMLFSFLDKVIESMKVCMMPLDLQVVVADNSTIRQEIDVEQYKCVKLKVCQLDNLGYLGGAQYVINNINNITEYDFIAISNVDLKLDISFLNSLCTNSYPENVGWIAPSIYSLQEKREKKTLSRPPKWKFVIMRELYRFPLLYKWYYHSLYKRKKVTTRLTEEQNIYAGHGAFILLTNLFFQTYKKLDYPVFLFCEENYIAELIRKAGMTVRYYPSLKIWDSEHASIGKINFVEQCKLNYEAVDYILKTFY